MKETLEYNSNPTMLELSEHVRELVHHRDYDTSLHLIRKAWKIIRVRRHLIIYMALSWKNKATMCGQ